MKKIEINDNKKQKIIVISIIFIILITIAIFICNIAISKKVSKDIVTVAYEDEQVQELEWTAEDENTVENIVDINNIIEKNLSNQIKEVLETKTVELEYETQYKNNRNLPKGLIQVLQQGQDGVQELTIKKQYEGDKKISDEQIGSIIKKAPIDRIVEVGTSNSYNNYKIKIGDTVYATPYDLDIRKDPKKDAEVIIKIDQDSKLKIKKKKGSWYYIKYDTYYGWVESDCVTYITPNSTTTNKTSNNKKYSNKQLLSKLNKNMKLNQPSGLTLEQFEKIFENESKDKNNVFKENAKYFYYIEQSYGINGVFVAAIGIHESAWGTSRIAKDKKNLFGYGAYDMSAYSSAYSYNGYAAGIDMIARVLVKHYLNPKGTSIYNGETATGKYYNGSTVAGVGKKYATDKKWSNSVYKWMEYLYNRL